MKTNWRVYERDHLYPQGISAYLDLLQLKPSPETPFVANHNDVFCYKGDYFWWARDIDLLKKTAEEWINGWLSDKERLKQIIGLYERSRQKMKEKIPELRKIDVKKISNSGLYEVYFKAKSIFLGNIIFSEYATDNFDDFFGEIFKEFLLQLNKEITEHDVIELMQPAYISESLNYKKEMLNLSLTKEIFDNELNQLADKYGWIAMSWDGSHEIDAEHVKKDIERHNSENLVERAKELRRINGIKDTIAGKRKELIEKYNLDASRLDPYFFLLDKFALFHDWRKETQMRCNQVIFPCLKEMASRFDVEYKDILFYLNPEIKHLCLDNVRVEQMLLEKRKKAMLWVISDGLKEEYLGDEAIKKLDELVLSVIKAENVSEVKGIPANKGRLVGRVFLAKSAKSANLELREGEILVTSMTTIDYLPAMRKASAIVTDDGGITCHAAIVSRELGKPCIVGTKIATQVFEHGDKVEVDAVNGIVRKLS
ncbi:MAG: PEP-utilizing enzyme [Candidatus Woesearchaeota archaeon]